MCATTAADGDRLRILGMRALGALALGALAVPPPAPRLPPGTPEPRLALDVYGTPPRLARDVYGMERVRRAGLPPGRAGLPPGRSAANVDATQFSAQEKKRMKEKIENLATKAGMLRGAGEDVSTIEAEIAMWRGMLHKTPPPHTRNDARNDGDGHGTRVQRYYLRAASIKREEGRQAAYYRGSRVAGFYRRPPRSARQSARCILTRPVRAPPPARKPSCRVFPVSCYSLAWLECLECSRRAGMTLDSSRRRAR